MALSVNAQLGIFGAAATGISLYGASSKDMSDRARLTTAGMAAVFGAASALSGFKVWAGINAGVVAGTLGAMALNRMRGDDDAAPAKRAPAPAAPPERAPWNDPRIAPAPATSLTYEQALAIERLATYVPVEDAATTGPLPLPPAPLPAGPTTLQQPSWTNAA